jgi:hypothetical protein
VIRIPRRTWAVALGVVLGFSLFPGPDAGAQDTGPFGPESSGVVLGQTFDVTPEPLRQSEPPITTRAAFIRGLLIPGWGHVGTESYFRGGVFVAVQTSAYWMVWKSISQRGEARRLREMERSIAEDRLRAQGILDPDSLAFLSDQDPALERWDTLLERRDEQVEDWIFLSAFLALLGAVDAFVAAHLWDFPEALALGVGPGPGPFDARNPSVEVQISVTPELAARVLPWRRGR